MTTPIKSTTTETETPVTYTENPEYRWGRVDQALISIAESLKLLRENAATHAASDNQFQGQITQFVQRSIEQDTAAIAKVNEINATVVKGFDDSIRDRKLLHEEITAIKYRMYWIMGAAATVAAILGFLSPIIIAVFRKLLVGV